jgi:hypothetical protein
MALLLLFTRHGSANPPTNRYLIAARRLVVDIGRYLSYRHINAANEPRDTAVECLDGCTAQNNSLFNHASEALCQSREAAQIK